MQIKAARERRKEWGGKPCDHPSVQREYYLSMHTGDLVCEQCGQEFTPSQWEEIKQLKAEGKPIPQPPPPKPSNYPYIIEIEHDDGFKYEVEWHATRGGRLKANKTTVEKYESAGQAEQIDPPGWERTEAVRFDGFDRSQRTWKVVRWRKIRPPSADRSRIPWEECD